MRQAQGWCQPARILALLTTCLLVQDVFGSCPPLTCPSPETGLFCSEKFHGRGCSSTRVANQSCAPPHPIRSSDSLKNCTCCCCSAHKGISSAEQEQKLWTSEGHTHHPKFCEAPLPELYNIRIADDQPEAHGCSSSHGTSRETPFGEVLNMSRDLLGTNQYALGFWFDQQVAQLPLRVSDCKNADIVYVPITTIYGGCGLDAIDQRYRELVAHRHDLLPLLGSKPHFMVLPRVPFWNAIDTSILQDLGVIILTIEGDGSDTMVTVPYPSCYHSHAGLVDNRFLQQAMEGKSLLAYQKFGSRHGKAGTRTGESGALRAQLERGCTEAGKPVCEHAMVKDYHGADRLDAEAFYKAAASAWFCIQPNGDTPTRRSTFDGLMAGCIPVFFEQSAVDMFPYADLINPLDFVVKFAPENATHLYTVHLPQIALDTRQQLLANIFNVNHIFQYSLTPRAGLLRWDTASVIAFYDDAFTFSLKSLIRKLCQLKQLDNVRCEH